jgi:23S rRNA (adenine2030-N6)-methyltransferase
MAAREPVGLNYRHAYHAGNFADCMKHALLVCLLSLLQRKPGGMMVLDTHAGTGWYDLSEARAERTGEWRRGIGRLLDDPQPPALEPYLSRVGRLGLYPGSPAIIADFLRPQDRLICCEFHPEDHAALRARFAANRQIAVHHRDGWEALRAFLPPRERRGLVLIDPPYEATDEFDRLAAGLIAAQHRFPSGVLAAWYPIKHRGPVRAFQDAIRAGSLRDVIAAELWLREPLDPARLNGCGLAIVNPPYGFEEAAAPIAAALLERLGDRERGKGTELLRLAEE